MHIFGQGRTAFLTFINHIVWSSALLIVPLLVLGRGGHGVLGSVVSVSLLLLWFAVVMASLMGFWNDLESSLPDRALALKKRRMKGGWLSLKRMRLMTKSVWRRKKVFYLDFIVALFVPLLALTCSMWMGVQGAVSALGVPMR